MRCTLCRINRSSKFHSLISPHQDFSTKRGKGGKTVKSDWKFKAGRPACLVWRQSRNEGGESSRCIFWGAPLLSAPISQTHEKERQATPVSKFPSRSLPPPYGCSIRNGDVSDERERSPKITAPDFSSAPTASPPPPPPPSSKLQRVLQVFR